MYVYVGTGGTGPSLGESEDLTPGTDGGLCPGWDWHKVVAGLAGSGCVWLMRSPPCRTQEGPEEGSDLARSVF